MKVIHLLCHTIPFKKDYVFDGWPARLAKQLLKYSQEYTHECWFAVNNINKPQNITRDKIKYRLFPAWTLNKKLESFFGVVVSNSLISSLKEEVRNGNVILHIQGERGFLVWRAIETCRNIPVVVQFHGYKTPDVLLFFERFIIAPAEKYFFKSVDYFFVNIKYRIDYLVNTLHIFPGKVINQNIGVDYDIFKPIDKRKARKSLNIPQNKNVILYVGLFNQTKGVKIIIDAHLRLKKKLNTYLILIGGAKEDEYYGYCKENADLVLKRIKHNLLPLYFNAADVYCMVCPKDKIRYGGLGIASIEALACNLPILNSNLSDAPEEIREKIGFKTDSIEDLIDKMTYVFHHKKYFKNLRQFTYPYFSWENVIENILKLYNNLRKNYLIKK